MPLAVGDRLHNRYHLLAELGRGGMGAVYRAHDENLGVDVAIKENLFVSPRFAEQFRREATLLASLRHPNLPRVTDHFVLPGQGQYLVMDFVAGEDAGQRYQRLQRPLPERDVLAWAADILNALDYLHRRQPPVVHRDLKPGNIKLTPEGRAVLVDFGLAKSQAATEITAAGAKGHSPGYSPPEQYGRGRTDPRSDLYSLAATLYTLLAAQKPPDGLERALGHASLVALRQLNPQVSAPTAAAIERALSLSPDARFATAAEFLAALPRASAAPPVAAPRPATVPPPAGSAAGPVARPPSAALPAAIPPGPGSPSAAPPPASNPPVPAPAAAAPPRPGGLAGWLIATLIGLVLLIGLVAGGGLLAFNLLFARRAASPSPVVVASRTPLAVVALTVTATPLPPLPATTVPATTVPPKATVRPGVTASPRPTAATARPSATLPPATSSPATSSPATSSPATSSPATSSPPTAVPATSSPPTAVPGTPLGGGAGQIAFASERGGLPQIYLINADGSHLTQLTHEADGACQPAWSPDGRQLLFVAPCPGQQDSYPGSALYLVNADGSGVRPFITLLGGAYDPAWSTSGVAFVHPVGNRPQIYMAQGDGTGAHDISALHADDHQPAWSPDGQRLAYANKSRTGVPTLYWMFADGSFRPGYSNPDAITRGLDASAPAWSPAGQFVAFVSGGGQILVAGWDQRGFGLVTLAPEGSNAHPAWSPDGQWLVFESWRAGGQHDLYRMTVTGSQVTRLTNDAALDDQPAWRP